MHQSTSMGILICVRCWCFNPATSARSRESKHLQQLEEQQRFAQQLQQLADPTAAAPGASAAAAAVDAEALAAIVEGLGSGAGSAAKLAAAAAANPALLIANTWALDGIAEESESASFIGLAVRRQLSSDTASAAAGADAGSGGVGAAAIAGSGSAGVSSEAAVSEAERAEAAAAAAVQQYYRQLHEAARQQAALNAQVKGTYGLKAYKGAARTKKLWQRLLCCAVLGCWW